MRVFALDIYLGTIGATSPHQAPNSLGHLIHLMVWPGMSAQKIHLLSTISVTRCPQRSSCTILIYTGLISPHKRHRTHLYLVPHKHALHCVGPAASLQTSSGYVFAIISMHARVAITESAGCPATPSRSSLRPTSIAATFLHQSAQLIIPRAIRHWYWR